MNKKQFLILMLGIAFFATKTGLAMVPPKKPTLQELAAKKTLEGLFNDIQEHADVANFDIYNYMNATLPVSGDPRLNKLRMDVFLKVLLFSDKFSVLRKLVLIDEIKKEIANLNRSYKQYNTDMLKILEKWFGGFKPGENITAYSKNEKSLAKETLLHQIVYGIGNGEESFEGPPTYYKNLLDIAFELEPTFKLNIPDIFESTLLHVAVTQGNVALVEKLLNKGVDKNAQSRSKNTPLHLALTARITPERKKKIVALLLEKGADPTIFNDDGLRPRELLTRQDLIIKELQDTDKILSDAEQKVFQEDPMKAFEGVEMLPETRRRLEEIHRRD